MTASSRIRAACAIALATCLAFSQAQPESPESVHDLLATVGSSTAPENARLDALAKAAPLLWRSDLDVAVREQVLSGILTLLLSDESPPRLALASIKVLRSLGNTRTVAVLAVVCDANQRPEEVRLAAIEAIAEVGGVAAIPTLVSALSDKTETVSAVADRSLEGVCWTPTADAGRVKKWRQFFATSDGEKMLVAAFVKLRNGVTGVHHLVKRGLPSHVVPFVLDESLGDVAWDEAYQYLSACVEGGFPVDAKADRKQKTAAAREWWLSR